MGQKRASSALKLELQGFWGVHYRCWELNSDLEEKEALLTVGSSFQPTQEDFQWACIKEKMTQIQERE